VKARRTRIDTVNRHFQHGVSLRAIDDAGVAGGGLRILMTKHVLHRAQIVRVAVTPVVLYVK